MERQIDPMDREQQASEPSGIALAAARLLRRELEGRAGLPTVEELAVILDRDLRYSQAIRLIRYAEMELKDTCGPGFSGFGTWVYESLLQ